MLHNTAYQDKSPAYSEALDTDLALTGYPNVDNSSPTSPVMSIPAHMPRVLPQGNEASFMVSTGFMRNCSGTVGYEDTKPEGILETNESMALASPLRLNAGEKPCKRRLFVGDACIFQTPKRISSVPFKPSSQCVTD